MLDVYGDTLLFLSPTPPSNRPESADAADFTEGGSSHGSSPTASAVSLGFSCSRGGCRDSRSEGGCSLGLPGDVEDDEEDEEDIGLYQPRLGPGLLGWLRYWGAERLLVQPADEAPDTVTLVDAKGWSG